MGVRWAFDFSKWHPSESDLLSATACLQPDDKERIGRFVFKKDFKASLIGRLMLRKYVHEATSTPYKDVRFVRDQHGKPVLAAPPADTKVNFNISHHGSYSVLAGEIGDCSLGVDVMKFEYTGGKDLNEYFRVMRRQFSPGEWREIRCRDGDRLQIESFCRHWALKESYCKAIGTGIYGNLQDLSFKINTRGLSESSIVRDTELFVKNEKLDWVFEETLLDAEHCVAVALKDFQGDGNGVFKMIRFDELMENAVPLLAPDEEYCKNYFRKEEKP